MRHDFLNGLNVEDRLAAAQCLNSVSYFGRYRCRCERRVDKNDLVFKYRHDRRRKLVEGAVVLILRIKIRAIQSPMSDMADDADDARCAPNVDGHGLPDRILVRKISARESAI